MEYQSLEELKIAAQKYDNIKSEDLVKLFREYHIYFPDFVNRFLLVNACKKYFFDPIYLAQYTDEFSYKLRSYQFFSIHLIRSTIKDNNIIVNPQDYKNLFIRFFLKNQKKFNSNINLDSLLEKSSNSDEENTETFEECLTNFDSIFYTPKGYLDGLSLSIIKEAIIETYNVVYLRDLGLKYGVDIPKRINKQQLQNLISARFMLSDEERQEISNKAIIDLIQYSKKKGFKVSSELKKSDMAEYLIYQLNKYNEEIEKDLYNYDIILDEEKNIETIQQAEIEHTDQGIPTSSELVDSSYEDIILNDEIKDDTSEEELPQEELPQEEELVQEEIIEETSISQEPQEELPQEETPVEDNIPQEEEKPSETKEEPQEETKDEEDLIPSDLYYDQSTDEEIRDIIKKYYSKMLNRDSLFKWILIVIIVLLCITVAYFAIMYYTK
ncbi:hypothetical protein J6Y73_05225 [bacterium]|nr:hypothetical protein [bacterium]